MRIIIEIDEGRVATTRTGDLVGEASAMRETDTGAEVAGDTHDAGAAPGEAAADATALAQADSPAAALEAASSPPQVMDGEDAGSAPGFEDLQ